MVKFAKNGSDATTAAVKLARAATGRQLVAICRTQPFFSTDDWFIGTTPMDAGTLDEERRAHRRLRLQRPRLGPRACSAGTPGEVACVILEAATALAEPAPGFLEGLRRAGRRDGFVLVFDEMITGCAGPPRGAQHVYGVTPDLSTWGKALGNGFPISALAGRRDLMELGGLRTDAPGSSCSRRRTVPRPPGLAAYLAVGAGLPRARRRRRDGAAGAALADGCRTRVAPPGSGPRRGGRPAVLPGVRHPRTRRAPSQAYRTLFLQEMLRPRRPRPVLRHLGGPHRRGHRPDGRRGRGRLAVYRKALDAGSTAGLLRGRPVAPALRRSRAPAPAPGARVARAVSQRTSTQKGIACACS